ncbi:ATP-binding cassette domain-containing protein [Clostridium bornimense]|uniref:ABC transporter ATP-binding protein n=1 Tax=Clostridium bornimense TaxID=1216932 RepID=UPI001C0F6AA3|nr:ATP-binding cassette domain-containing protein [Clostridium bornimense]MBU5316586.1 ATP-binding cassette domain-containing protein [Clostridium bornimense]
MSEVILSMKDVTKIYNETKALDKVSIEINRGDIYGIIGNNGAGKTTIMRIISGQSFVSSGTMELFGSKDDDVRKQRKRLGCLIENPGFCYSMTAYENLEYFRIQFGIPGKENINKVLEEVGLRDCGKKKYKDFSLGMKQRLGIALAILNSPELLILDEPTNGLDPEGIIEIRNILINLNKKKNTTILISSHILSELSNIATKYGFLKNGKIIEEISMEDLQRKCESYIDITVDKVEAMCIVLEKELNYKNYKVYANNHIHLYQGIDDIKKICETAVLNNIGILEVVRKVKNLENYYMNMMEEN